MNFTKKILDFAKKHFTPPRPQQQPKGKTNRPTILRMTLARLNEMRRRFRLGNQRVTGAFGRKRAYIDPKPALNAARGARPNTWWKQAHRHQWCLQFCLVPVVYDAPYPTTQRPIGDRARDRKGFRRHQLGGVTRDKWAK